MGWGTQFNTDIFLNKVSLDKISEVDDAIEECEAMIRVFEQELLILASLNNTPNKDRTLEDVIFDIRARVNEAFGGAKEEIQLLTRLSILKEHLENGGEVILG